MARKSTEKLRDMMSAKRKSGWVIEPPNLADMLGSGSTLLNLACTDTAFGCFVKGCYYIFVGDSSSGKTFLSLTCFAEAMLNKAFKDYRLIFDDVEGGAMMNFAKFFGERVAKRVEHPSKNGPSRTVEDFYDNIDNALIEADAGRPFIYVLDSQDALDSEYAEEKFNENKKARAKGNDTKGSFGDGKAKKHSENLRRVVGKLKQTGSILILISQTRDNIEMFSFEKKTRSGGRALKFYTALEIWSSVMGKIKKQVAPKKYVKIGIESKLEVKKNRITGKDRIVEMNIFNSYGIDDIGACIDYLIENEHWKKVKGVVTADEFDFAGTRDQLVRHIEKDEGERELRVLVESVWNGIEKELQPKRKKRYE